MSQSSNYSTGADTLRLAACARCNSRQPIETLSQSHQLCKDCRGSHVIKCNYCRSEFHQESVTNGHSNKPTNRICSKCQVLETQHGQPGPCAYCNIIAAFIGTRCQRCTNSEKKYGPPLVCEHCRQKCAFDREDRESKKKVDNKLLCWLCTMAYKRTLAKARQKEEARLLAGGQRRLTSTDNRTSSSSKHHHHHHNQRHQTTTNLEQTFQNSSSSAQNQRSISNHTSSKSSRSRDLSTSSVKKQRTEVSSINNSSSMPAITTLSDNRFMEPNVSNDMTAVVAQLKEQVSSLNKRLQLKEKELLSKDQQIAELRATITREQRESKEKMNTIQKQHSERMSELQAKIITMQKQMVSQTKAARASAAATLVEPPLVI